MIEWRDYGYFSRSVCTHYDICVDGMCHDWAVNVRNRDERGALRYVHVQRGFATREEAKQWCEMYEATGGRE